MRQRKRITDGKITQENLYPLRYSEKSAQTAYTNTHAHTHTADVNLYSNWIDLCAMYAGYTIAM